MKKPIYLFLFFLFLLNACSGSFNPVSKDEVGSSTYEGALTLEPSATSSPAPTASLTPVPSHTPTLTPVPPTFTPTPAPLAVFSSNYLLKGIEPVTYLGDPCTYLENRWSEDKSQPGTIVVPIMFHSVAQPDRTIKDSTTISMEYFEYFMARAKQLGFSTITIDQLIGFLENNEKIPERSMILILDDRRPGVTRLFMPYLELNDWTLTLAWLTRNYSYDEIWWDEIETLAETGRLDVQSHGHNSVYIQDYTDIEIVEEELFQPMALIQEHIGTTPQAHIWSGGNFTQTSIDMAHEAGFLVGFTAFSRGPVMFNWVPLGEQERAVNDPLMVLPRYWSTAALGALEEAIRVAEEARLYAEEVKSSEMNYLSVYCQGAAGE